MIEIRLFHPQFETFEKCSILPAQLNLLKFNRGSSSSCKSRRLGKVKILTRHDYRRVNHPDEIGTGIHTLSILRIALWLHFVQNVEPDVPPLREAKGGVLQRSQF